MGAKFRTILNWKAPGAKYFTGQIRPASNGSNGINY